MRIGVAGPIDLTLLAERTGLEQWMPATWSFPLTAELVAEFLEHGQQVVVYALSEEVRTPFEVVHGDLLIRILPRRSDGQARTRDFSRIEIAFLQDAMRQDSCDVIHAHWTYEFALAAVASGLPNVVTAHDHPWRVVDYSRHGGSDLPPIRRASVVTRNAARAATRAWMATKAVRMADQVTAVSPSVKQHIERTMRPPRPVIVIPNGVRPTGASPRMGVADAQRPVFACINNGWQNSKNTERAIEALALVRREIPGARLMLIGTDYEAGGPAHAWTKAHNLAEGCSWIGAQPYEDVMRLLREDIDVLVHPGLHEAFGMVLLEAMSVGVPCIGGVQAGGVPFVLAGGHSGVLVDVSSSDALAAALAAVATDVEFYRATSQAGLLDTLDRFRLDKVAADYLSVLSPMA